MAEGAEGDAVFSLPKLFLRGWEAWRRVDTCEVTSGTVEHAKCLSDGASALERATRMANQLDLFSGNEQVEEVATTSFKYMLLPALLGDLSLQNMEEERLETIRKARIYFVDYLHRCRSYGITQDEPPPLSLAPHTPSPSKLTGRKSYKQLATERSAKIERLRQQKELERRAGKLTSLLSSRVAGREGEKEEEEGREEWMALLQLWVLRCQDLIRSVDEEVGLLQHGEGAEPFAKQPEGACGTGPADVARAPMKPFVITREMLKRGVFGAGYPSLPTMSVEEFYQQRYREMERGEGEGEGEGGGGRGGGGGGEHGHDMEKEEEQEEEEEEESEESLRKAREWDEFKDDNRRGWGNKRNMG